MTTWSKHFPSILLYISIYWDLDRTRNKWEGNRLEYRNIHFAGAAPDTEDHGNKTSHKESDISDREKRKYSGGKN